MLSRFKTLELTRVRTMPLLSISCRDSFFDSLRNDYSEFDEWYNRVASQGRNAWVVDSIDMPFAALCIFKIESEGELITDDGQTLKGEFLKICTLKVQERGIKYGERLLYTAFHYAKKNGLSNVYIQVRKGSHRDLVKLLSRYGFIQFGRYKKDVSFVKRMLPGKAPAPDSSYMERLDYDISFYPYYLDGPLIKKFLLSIPESVHDNLFPDARTQTLAFPVVGRPVVGEMDAICKSCFQVGNVPGICPSDLLFFYAKGSDCNVTCMGFVEDYYLCPKGSVCPIQYIDRLPFSRTEIARMLSEQDMMLINFRLIQYLNAPIGRKTFSKSGFEVNHRSILAIPNDIYSSVIKPRLNDCGVE